MSAALREPWVAPRGQLTDAMTIKESVMSKKSKITKKPVKPTTAIAPVKATKSSVARELIQQGKTNEQVLDALMKQFDLDPATQKSYPAWYRSELRRGKKLSKAALALEVR